MAYKNQKKNKRHIAWLRFQGQHRSTEYRKSGNSLQALIITWKRPSVTFAPFLESFFTKSDDSAKRIIDRRQKENMVSAILQERDILKMK